MAHHRGAARRFQLRAAFHIERADRVDPAAPFTTDEIGDIIGKDAGLAHFQSVMDVKLVAPFVDDLADRGNRGRLFAGEFRHALSLACDCQRQA